MATTPASLEKTLEETVKISATLETGSLPSARRNLEAVFFDLDDSLVLIHAADTVAHKAVQVCMYSYGKIGPYELCGSRMGPLLDSEKHNRGRAAIPVIVIGLPDKGWIHSEMHLVLQAPGCATGPSTMKRGNA
ncbi:unnamed protein product [Sphagnum troendelagicum]